MVRVAQSRSLVNEFCRSYSARACALYPLDILLADIAVGMQLTPTDYQAAEDHYHAIRRHLEREDSPLFGVVEKFYPQGGFAIGATVARHSTDDEFDIDVMVQLALDPNGDPDAALALLHKAIGGEPGSRYQGKAERLAAPPSPTTACI